MHYPRHTRARTGRSRRRSASTTWPPTPPTRPAAPVTRMGPPMGMIAAPSFTSVLHQPVRGDWQVALALAGRVVDGVGAGGGTPGNRQLAYPPTAQGVDVGVGAIDEVGLDVRGVCVDRDGIVGEVVSHGAGRAPVVDRVLHQGGADTHD